MADERFHHSTMDEKNGVDHHETSSQMEQIDEKIPKEVDELGPGEHIGEDSIRAGGNEAIYREALERYPTDESIDRAEEKKLIRKLDLKIIPVLGICYFFYYVDKTTLSYAAIYGIREDLNLTGTDYSWLSSIFYFGWLVWAIPSNLILQRLPPAYYLAFNIFMWGALLMCQAAANTFEALAALRALYGAFEAIADPAFMIFVAMYYTREEQPMRISAYYLWNGIGVGGGGLIGYGIGNLDGALASWRYEFIIVGAVCAAWGIAMWFALPNTPRTFYGFTHEEKLLMIARVRVNQTGIEQNRVNWGQIKQAFMDYKTYMFLFFGFIANIPNGGISNFSTLVIQGLGYDKLRTSLLGIPQGVIIVMWIVAGAYCNKYAPPNYRTIVAACFMLPAIAGGFGFLLAPDDAYVGRLICFYLTGSYQASFIMTLSLITSNIGGQSKKMIVSGLIWFGVCVGNITSPFFYFEREAPTYTTGIGSLLAANIIELMMFGAFRYCFIWENKKKEKQRAEMREAGQFHALNSTAFKDLTDRDNPNFTYVY